MIVFATRGERGLARDASELAGRREGEAEIAARALGAAKVVHLGYADSGMDGAAGGARAFTRSALDEAAAELAAILIAERAEVLTIYDARGGYGHPDHVQVHAVGSRAAVLAGTPLVLEATVPREALHKVLRWVSWIPRLPAGFTVKAQEQAFTVKAELTHRVNVRAHLPAKRAALAAHASQRSAPKGNRTLSVLLALPRPLSTAVLGQEWFVEQGCQPRPVLSDDIFEGLGRPVSAAVPRTDAP